MGNRRECIQVALVLAAKAAAVLMVIFVSNNYPR